MDTYATKLQAQIDQYREVADIHDLPDIFHYWSNKHLRQRLNHVMGAESVVDFYASRFATALGTARSRRLASIGAGDCSVEMNVARRLLELGHQDFELVCLEVSPHLLERADAALKSDSAVGRVITLQEVDINRWAPADRYAGIMANHSLHHFVELEHIFGAVHDALEGPGVFVTNDMIGRNGHMRWPEVLEFVASIWAFMPDRYKFNRQLNRFEPEFVNWDCSNEGFEGVRAQDILPLLNRMFGFESFLGFGGIVDVFVGRAFGHNFDPNAATDSAFVDFLQLLDDRLTDGGMIKPTTMFAVMGKARGLTPRVWRTWTPGFCERIVEAPSPGAEIGTTEVTSTD